MDDYLPIIVIATVLGAVVAILLSKDGVDYAQRKGSVTPACN